jgi:Asp-tRNA(Asn)/Glu-tRNA(Gln) amidotransferase A subunit family amidase
MNSWLISSAFLSIFLAICAVLWAVSVTFRLSATIARVQSQLSDLQKTERLTPSRIAQLSEFNEALNRAEELLVKVNRREIARSKARDTDGTFTGSPAALKDHLRQKAGLRAGQHPMHS